MHLHRHRRVRILGRWGWRGGEGGAGRGGAGRGGAGKLELVGNPPGQNLGPQPGKARALLQIPLPPSSSIQPFPTFCAHSRAILLVTAITGSKSVHYLDSNRAGRQRILDSEKPFTAFWAHSKCILSDSRYIIFELIIS